MLPAQYREQFMTEYEAAVAGARQPAYYRRLRTLLRLWRLRAAAYSDPGFEARLAAAQAAMAGDQWDGIPARDVVPDWDEKIAAARRRAG
jgi:hypothetical protein